MEIRIQSTGAVMLEGEFRRYIHDTTGGSFDRITPEILAEHGADPVFEGPQASGGTVYQYSMRSGVEQSGGKWYTKYILGPVFRDITDETGKVTTAAEQEAAYKLAKDAERAKAVRDDRNKRLSDCDWTQLPDNPLANKADWATYRQQLRDVTSQTGFPWEVTWPTEPA